MGNDIKIIFHRGKLVCVTSKGTKNYKMLFFVFAQLYTSLSYTSVITFWRLLLQYCCNRKINENALATIGSLLNLILCYPKTLWEKIVMYDQCEIIDS